ERRIERYEYRGLDEHRYTATDRIHLLLAIHEHRLLVHAPGVVLVETADLLEARLQLLHAAHGPERLLGERPEDELGEHRHDDDHEAVVRNELVEECDEEKERAREGADPAPAELDRGLHADAQGADLVVNDRSGVDAVRVVAPARRRVRDPNARP